MRRPRKIVLLALLLALAGTAAVPCGIQDTMQRAAVTETTLFGDVSAAEGVELCFGGTSDGKLSWEHRWRFGGSGTAETTGTDADRARQNVQHTQSTSVTYGSPQETVTRAWPYLRACVDAWSPNVSLQFLWSNPIDPDNAALTEEEQAGKTEGAKRRAAVRSYFTEETPTILQDLQRAFDAGEKTKAEIRMQDLLRYYQLELELTGQDNHVLHVWCSESDYNADTEEYKNYVSIAGQERFALWESFNRFFRIPVLESESRVLEAEWDSISGVRLSYELNRAKNDLDYFSFETIACGTPEAVYFTFDPHSYRGELVDTSQIPGGYGLYKLPYDPAEKVFLPEKLEMVYPLEPARDYVSVHSSPDGQKLLLTSRTWQFGDTGNSSWYGDTDPKVTEFDRARRLTAEVVDLASMTREKTLDVLQSRSEIECRDAGDYLVFSDAVSKICVIAYQDGNYHKTLDLADLAMASSPDEDLPCYGYLKQMAYDGERLVLAGYSYVKADRVYHTQGVMEPQSDAELAVYDRRGLAYFGRLTDNLQDYTEEEGFAQWAETLKIKLPAARHGYYYRTPESALNVMTLPTDIKVTIGDPSTAA